MRFKYVIFLGLVAILLVGGYFLSDRIIHQADAAQAQLRPMSVGSISPMVSSSKQVSSAQTARTLQLSVGLALRNQAQLNALLHDLYNPASQNYHHFLTVQQFAQQFGPTATQQKAVMDYLKQQGFTITQTYPDGLLIDFTGPQSLAERVFGVQIHDYQAPDGHLFYANSSVPHLPAFIAQGISYIGGLDNANRFHHASLVSKYSPVLIPSGSAASNCPAPGQSGGGSGGGGIFGGGTGSAYIPSQFSKAYNYDGLHSQRLQGEGQTVGLFELDGYALSDVQTYTQCFGGGNVPLQNVVLDGFNGQPGAGAVEVELDMEVILSMAPNLSKMIVYEAPNTTQGYNDEFARIVSDRTPVVSVSWGDCEKNMGQQELQQEGKYFQEAAAQGQSILVASGDSGSSSCLQLQAGIQGFDPSLQADDPAAQPYVTAVGGTTLSINADNSYQSEHVWNGGLLGGAGGGGLSQYWKQPDWQKGPGVQNSYSNGMREYPDVSLDADPATGYPIYCTAGSSCSSSSGGIFGGGTSGGWLTIGGTSAAAPMWAAMVVLANELSAKQGKSVLGFLNPALYSVGSGSAYASDFHDIIPPTDGSPANNDEVGFNGGAYPVTPGYDMATGWGTFDAAKLAAELVSLGK